MFGSSRKMRIKDEQIASLQRQAEYYRNTIEDMKAEQGQMQNEEGKLFRITEQFHECCAGCPEVIPELADFTRFYADHVCYAVSDMLTLTCSHYELCNHLQRFQAECGTVSDSDTVGVAPGRNKSHFNPPSGDR